MNWFDLPQEIAKKFKVDYFTVSCQRGTDTQPMIDYTVTYLMEKENSPYNKNDNKYAMFIKWSEGGKIAIIIGQNPSKCKTILSGQRFHPDDTNWNIIKLLKQHGYDGYIMLNTFSKIDPDGGKNRSIPKQSKNIKIANCILGFECLQNVKIILACSTTNNIAYDFMNALKNSKKALYAIYVETEEQYELLSHFSSRSLPRSINRCDRIILESDSLILKEINTDTNTCKWDIKVILPTQIAEI